MDRTFVLTTLLFFPFILRAQVNPDSLDPALARKITVSGICLCRTTLSDLQQRGKDLAEVDVEEMDLGKRCAGIVDSRYISGKGYFSKTFPGMIFEKDDEGYISKIRLTSGFKGNLPDGTFVNLDSMHLKDVFRSYPYLQSKWGSRDCSDFWSFSNDTIAFYVRIDSTKKPQFPIDEAYYLNKPVAGIDILISCYDIFHKSDSVSLFEPDEPMCFLDSIRVNLRFLKLTNPADIAMVTVYKGNDAIRAAGKGATNGAIYVVTKPFAREVYWAYLKTKSEAYRSQVLDLKTEAGIAYILNGKVLSENQEAALFLISDSNFIDLKIIDQSTLEKTYYLTGHTIGVVIRSRPRNLK